jgi:hypothetical protein
VFWQPADTLIASPAMTNIPTKLRMSELIDLTRAVTRDGMPASVHSQQL